MNWEQIFGTALVAFLGVALPPLTVMFLNWLKKQKWVQKLHLEGFFEAMVPQVVQWVEYWAQQLAEKGEKPSGEDKMAKFVELLKKEAPDNLKGLTDEDIAMRAEAELMKLKKSLNGSS